MNDCWRRLPSGGRCSHTPTSPFACTTALNTPARQGTYCCSRSAALSLTHCSIGSTIEPYRPSSRGATIAERIVKVAVVLKGRAFQGWILAIAADDGQIVVRHLGAAIVEECRQEPDLCHVRFGGGRDRVDLQARILLLEIDQRVIGFHRLPEGVLRLSKLVVELGHSIQGELDGKDLQGALLQDPAQGGDCALGEVSIGGYVDLFHAVVADELPADGGELLSEERLASGEVEVLDRAQLFGEGHDLLQGKSSGWFNCCQ